jgi:hypothetical protein
VYQGKKRAFKGLPAKFRLAAEQGTDPALRRADFADLPPDPVLKYDIVIYKFIQISQFMRKRNRIFQKIRFL